MRACVPLFVLLSFGCQDATEAPPSEARSRAIATSESARTAYVRVQPPEDEALLEAPARALAPPDALERISALFPLRVLRVHVLSGDRVEAGAPILDVASAEVLGAVANVEGAERRLAITEARLEELERQRSQALITTDQVFALEREVRTLRAERGFAQATLRAAGVGRTTRTRGDGRIVLRARIGGVVRDVTPIAGDVFPNGGTFATIVGGEAVRIEARFPAPPPSAARYAFESLSGERHALGAPVRIIEDGERFGWLVWFDVPEGVHIPPSAEGHLHAALPEGPYARVPMGALVRRSGETFVARRRGDEETLVPVRVVLASGTSAIVEGALTQGDLVAEDGAASHVARSEAP